MIGLAAVLVVIVFGALIIGAVFSTAGGLVGAIWGWTSAGRAIKREKAARGHPMRSRTFEEIQAAKAGGPYVPDPRFTRR